MTLGDFFGPINTEKRISGVVMAIVTNNKDPEGLGRVKVKFPWLSDEDESNWARVATLMAGKNRGTYFLPEVDDEVLVAFEFGDISRPYVVGSLWNGVDKPPQKNNDGKNDIREIRSRSGHTIRLNDKEGKETIEITDKSGKNKITFNTKENTISLKAGKNIEISAPKGKVSIQAKEVEIESKAKTGVKAGSNMDLKAKGKQTIKGKFVYIN